MSRFKQWSSFWCKDQGFGMIEAALVLPLALLLTFGVIEFGNMFVDRYQARDVADAVGDFLQSKPNASSGELQTFVATLGLGTLKNTGPTQENSIFANIKIKAKTTLMTEAEFNDLCSTQGSVLDWYNPWGGRSSSNPYGNNPYYIHICYSYTYHAITPLPNLTGGGVPDTKTLRVKSVAFTSPELTCASGEFINNNKGKPECARLDADCPDGQYLKGVVGTTPVCATPSIVKGNRYRPINYTSDCHDYTTSVQVGYSPGHNKPVWCANLTIR